MRNRMRFVTQLLLILTLWGSASSAFAQDQPRSVSEQDVVERLIRLEEGQKTLTQRIEDLNTSLNQRIDDLRTEMNQRFEGVNRRFDDMNNRFNDVMTLLQIIVSTLVALVLAVAGAGFVMWRKILTVDSTVQTKIGLDQVIREDVVRLEQELGFVKGKLRELAEATERG